MRITTAIGAMFVAAGIATTASAADLPRQYTKAPAPVVAPMFNWTGFYIGANAGYGFADSSFGDADGFIGGGQIGYNWQGVGSPFVFGLEADLQFSDMGASSTIGPVTANADINGFGTLRARLGYAFDRAMIYGTGGLAFTNTELSLSAGGASVSDDDWSTGWTLGGGVEWAFMSNWSAKLEYLYVDSGDTTLSLLGTSVTGDYNFSVVRAGLNYRF